MDNERNVLKFANISVFKQKCFIDKGEYIMYVLFTLAAQYKYFSLIKTHLVATLLVKLNHSVDNRCCFKNILLAVVYTNSEFSTNSKTRVMLYAK